jgi:hypothetical protein
MITVTDGMQVRQPLAGPVPVPLLGGLPLWRRTSLGYVTAAELLLQYRLTPFALAFCPLLLAMVAGTVVDWDTSAGVPAFAVVCSAPLLFSSAPPWRQTRAAAPGVRLYGRSATMPGEANAVRWS